VGIFQFLQQIAIVDAGEARRRDLGGRFGFVGLLERPRQIFRIDLNFREMAGAHFIEELRVGDGLRDNCGRRKEPIENPTDQDQDYDVRRGKPFLIRLTSGAGICHWTHWADSFGLRNYGNVVDHLGDAGRGPCRVFRLIPLNPGANLAVKMNPAILR